MAFGQDFDAKKIGLYNILSEAQERTENGLTMSEMSRRCRSRRTVATGGNHCLNELTFEFSHNSPPMVSLQNCYYSSSEVLVMNFHSHFHTHADDSFIQAGVQTTSLALDVSPLGSFISKIRQDIGTVTGWIKPSSSQAHRLIDFLLEVGTKELETSLLW